MNEILCSVVAFIPSAIVTFAVLKQSKNVSALAQLGSLGHRSEVMDGIASDEHQKKLLDKEAEKVKDWDKIVYTLNTFNVGMTCFLLGRFPHAFFYWHCPKAVLLTGLRWYLFKGERKHYLLYDFCYWANGLSLFYIFVMPSSGAWFQVFFLTANGPLAWSILAFSQSIVLHDLQRMISVFIHISPMLLTISLRWSPSSFTTTTNPEEQPDDILSLTQRGILWFYLPWVIIYYAWVFVYLADRVRERGYQTLFDRIMSMTVGQKLANVPDSTPDQLLRKAVYLLSHLCFGSLTMLFAAFMYHSQVAHWTFALCVCSASAWNGAGFYSKVWASKYNEDVIQMAQQRLQRKAD